MFRPKERINLCTVLEQVTLDKMASAWLKVAPGNLAISKSCTWNGGNLATLESPTINHFLPTLKKKNARLEPVCVDVSSRFCVWVSAVWRFLEGAGSS